MTLTLVTGPQTEPLVLDDAKKHLKVSGTSEDDLITSLIKVARLNIERYLKRPLITQTWRANFHRFSDCMDLGLPVISVTSVKYYPNPEAAQATLSTDLYYADTISPTGKIWRKYNATFPELEYGRPNAVEVNFTSGYGDDVDSVPVTIIHAMKLLITDYYDNRGEVVVGTNATRIPGFIRDLIHDYRLYDFAH